MTPQGGSISPRCTFTWVEYKTRSLIMEMFSDLNADKMSLFFFIWLKKVTYFDLKCGVSVYYAPVIYTSEMTFNSIFNNPTIK